MKKFLVFAIPLLVAIAIFLGFLFFLDRQSRKGALQVTASPQSQVYLDNKLIGETPLCACELPQMIQVGDYSIKVSPKDTSFKPFEEKIAINKSTLTVIDRTFSKSGSFGSVVALSMLSNKKDIEILVESVPSKANVLLDNNPVGTTPLLLKDVGEGAHDLMVGKDGFKEKLIKISTTLGYRLTAKLFLGISDLTADMATPSGKVASSSATPRLKQVVILDTPTGFLRVREEGSVLSSEIGRVNPGETYEVLDEKDGWFRIQFDDDKSGWISGEYGKKE
ncbi:MAG: PEGA domain-containing protein [Patescibacteria group bacterium]